MVFIYKCKYRRLCLCFLAVLSAISGLGTARGAREETGKLVPLGRAVRIDVEMGCVLVTGLTAVDTTEGSLCPARQSGLASGDLILELDGEEVRDVASFSEAITDGGGRSVALTVERGGSTFETSVKPVSDGSGIFRIGVLAKDTVEGIGTLTYYDPETGTAAALGHGIEESGVLVPLERGIVTKTYIEGAEKGARGSAGFLKGADGVGEELGSVISNTPCGIFIRISDSALLDTGDSAAVETAIAAPGPARLLANVEGDRVEAFEIEITGVRAGAGGTKDFDVTVTDRRLLELTGGIVQGMSGSPILQNGELVGAVTHVLLSDPSRGYGISAENMLDTHFRMAA